MKIIAKTIALTTLSLICMSASAQQFVFKTEVKNAQNKTVTVERIIDLRYTNHRIFLVERLKEVDPEYYDQVWQYTKEVRGISKDDFFETIGWDFTKALEIMTVHAVEYFTKHPERLQ
ncbi:hypothetical protein AAX09_10375 (plasmid) [Moraxella bovoculi]|uniref:hypothetical protein n=1 Tax=Moraxella bovoculi TaxID=386891 RepID=UPI000624D2FE|nr:hypothetical protein [Moraxella bovoculi]AKG19879.1 hypothetical protein AAX09_10375 [Moraxella bovoculi]